MCGIHVVVSRDDFRPLPTETRTCLCNRGPDHLGEARSQVHLDGSAATTPVFLSFTSTVLALRGDHVTQQPFRDASSGSVLCWNGEAWKIGGRPVEGNDGELVFALLTAASSRDTREDAVLDALRSIEGPFAFAYFDAASSRLYFGRDRLGRRSLLLNQEDGLRLSSIAESISPAWVEVEADEIYVLELSAWGSNPISTLTPRPWSEEEADSVLNIGKFNTALPPSSILPLSATSAAVRAIREYLMESLKLRVLNVPPPPAHDANSDTRISVLFSGGLDCTILARMASDLLPIDQGIDLINVAFENPRLASRAENTTNGVSIYEACPDRITGRKSFAELAAVCPGRRWRFIAVDVPYQEVLAHRSQVVSLMYPHNTEMDLSIAYALYFAARGIGMSQSYPSDVTVQYATPARVLLSGLGADELFGGYVRHATAFSRRGYPGLLEELKLDVSRLGKRNLGRDDRAMAHWSREVRFPYLDEDFVKWAIECPVWEKCDFGYSEEDSGIEPGKRVLRLLAEALGMTSVAQEKKRAVSTLSSDEFCNQLTADQIQFGSRTAKMESGKTKGTTLIVP